MQIQKKYSLLKATTIALGALTIPWGTFTGFCFGEGRYFTGLVSLAAQTLVALGDGYIWFWVLENMRNRMQTGAANRSAQEAAELRPQSPVTAGAKSEVTGVPPSRASAECESRRGLRELRLDGGGGTL